MISNLFSSGIQVPAGKLVYFKPRGTSTATDFLDILSSKPFYLEEDITIRVSSNYQTLVGNDMNKGVVFIGELINSITGSSLPTAGFKQLGFQQWAGTEPLAFSFQVVKMFEKDAYNEVVVPSKLLMQLSVPTLLPNGSGMEAPGPTAWDMITNNDNTRTNTNKRRLDIQLGPLFISDCIIHAVDCTYSSEVTEDGYPIWVKMNVQAKSLYITNTVMIENMITPRSASSALASSANLLGQ